MRPYAMFPERFIGHIFLEGMFIGSIVSAHIGNVDIQHNFILLVRKVLRGKYSN